MYKSLVRPLLFQFPAEKAHHIAARLMKIGLSIPGVKSLLGVSKLNYHPQLEKELFGIKFPNPVGLAAGFDKDAKMFKSLGKLGFGFVEIGTLTPLAQPGNPKPRLFRLKEDNALINRMGFNNEGVDAAVMRLKKRNPGLIIGGNIGKNKVTANERATEDYIKCFQKLHPYVDYFVVNVSSPNTPNLRELQEKEPLTNLLNSLIKLNQQENRTKPILLKIAPDLSTGMINDIVEIMLETKLDGLIVNNTTIDRSGLKTSEDKLSEIGAGGLSGKPLRQKSTELIAEIKRKSNKAFPIIGVGGIHSAQDAIEKLDAGADLIQLYTGFIYEGPKLISDINKAILNR